MAYLINTSFHTTEAVANDALELIVRVFVPMIQKDSRFSNVIATRILAHLDGGASGFAVQFIAESVDEANEWFASANVKKFFDIIRSRYGSNLLHFTTPMEIVYPVNQ